MVLMNANRVVAKFVKRTEHPLPILVAESWTKFYDIPFDLFGYNKREVGYIAFVNWASDRCFPKERIGCKDLLSELDLDRYDGWEIVKKTKGILYTDHFWIDFYSK